MFNLLNLPAEIREMIWFYAVPSERKMRRRDPYHKAMMYGIPLMSVNRQVERECAPILYRRNVFCIRLDHAINDEFTPSSWRFWMALGDAEKEEELGFPSRYFPHVRGISMEYYPDGPISSLDKNSPTHNADAAKAEWSACYYHINDETYRELLAATIRWVQRQAPLVEYVGLRKFSRFEACEGPFSRDKLSQHLMKEIQLLTAIKAFTHLRGLDLNVVCLGISSERQQDAVRYHTAVMDVPDLGKLTVQRILRLPIFKAEIDFRLEEVLGFMSESTNYSFNLVPRAASKNWSVDRWLVQRPVFSLARRSEDWTWKVGIE